jgi:hypothetical protein
VFDEDMRSRADLLNATLTDVLADQIPAPTSTRDGVEGILRSRADGFGGQPEYARTFLDLALTVGVIELSDTQPVLPTRTLLEPVAPLREPNLDGDEPSDGRLPVTDYWAFYRPPQGLSLVEFATDTTAWGVYLLAGGIEHLARELQHEGLELAHALRVASLVLILHEHFHHTIAAASAMLSRFDRAHTYESYRQRADSATCHNPLEEALANAHAVRHLAEDEQRAVLHVMDRQPRGYRDAAQYVDSSGFETGCAALMAELADRPLRDLQAHQRVLLDAKFTHIDLSTVPIHLVESQGSSHELGEWRLPL